MRSVAPSKSGERTSEMISTMVRYDSGISSQGSNSSQAMLGPALLDEYSNDSVITPAAEVKIGMDPLTICEDDSRNASPPRAEDQKFIGPTDFSFLATSSEPAPSCEVSPSTCTTDKTDPRTPYFIGDVRSSLRKRRLINSTEKPGFGDKARKRSTSISVFEYTTPKTKVAEVTPYIPEFDDENKENTNHTWPLVVANENEASLLPSPPDDGFVEYNNYRLPNTRPTRRTSAFRFITLETLAEEYRRLGDDFERHYILIDARFDYEYVHGHLKFSINNWNELELPKIFFPDCPQKLESIRQRVPIFYCEFSRTRSQKMAGHLRSLDRNVNSDDYPYVYYPELYVLKDGYKNVWEHEDVFFKSLCTPPGYIEMEHPEFIHRLSNFSQHLSHAHKRRKRPCRYLENSDDCASQGTILDVVRVRRCSQTWRLRFQHTTPHRRCASQRNPSRRFGALRLSLVNTDDDDDEDQQPSTSKHALPQFNLSS